MQYVVLYLIPTLVEALAVRAQDHNFGALFYARLRCCMSALNWKPRLKVTLIFVFHFENVQLAARFQDTADAQVQRPHKADALSKSDGTWGLCYSKPDGLHVCHDQDHPLEEEVRPEMKLKRADGCHQLAGADYGGLLDTFNGWQVPNCNDKTWQWLARPPDRFAGKLWGQGHCFNQIDPNSFLADGQVLHSRELRASRVLFDMIWHIYRCDISIYIYIYITNVSKNPNVYFSNMSCDDFHRHNASRGTDPWWKAFRKHPWLLRLTSSVPCTAVSYTIRYCSRSEAIAHRLSLLGWRLCSKALGRRPCHF